MVCSFKKISKRQTYLKYHKRTSTFLYLEYDVVLVRIESTVHSNYTRWSEANKEIVEDIVLDVCLS